MDAVEICARLVPARKVRESASVFWPQSRCSFSLWFGRRTRAQLRLMQYGAGSALNVAGMTPSFWTTRISANNFFTLGLGDVFTLRHGPSLVVVEGGLGSDSSPESSAISRSSTVHLQARSQHFPAGSRAGTPATPANFFAATATRMDKKRCASFSRNGNAGAPSSWRASFLSGACFFRSQHDNPILDRLAHRHPRLLRV